MLWSTKEDIFKVSGGPKHCTPLTFIVFGQKKTFLKKNVFFCVPQKKNKSWLNNVKVSKWW